MGLSRLFSRGQAGLEAYEVAVEVHLAGGLPAFTIVGLPAAAVRESRDRVRAALQSTGLGVPQRRITAHLGPADIPKEGGRFDLPIALAVAIAQQQPDWKTENMEFIGELALNGELRPVHGVLPAVIAARNAGRSILLPRGNLAEAALVADARAFAADSLIQVLEHLNGTNPLQPVAPQGIPQCAPGDLDLGDVRGQPGAKRALLVAAAGGHNLLMVGPPGSGKSMLAQRLPRLLPPLSTEEFLCVASVASVAGAADALLIRPERPFRAPHHTASSVALVGGGTRARPGEISLAHLGVLFLDELPEFNRDALEAMREPLESGVVRIARANYRTVFPAQFQLVAAMNPCPCGYLGDGSDRCQCSATRLAQYRSRLSGPLLDRFDLHIDVPRVPFKEIAQPNVAHAESAAAAAVVAAAQRQQLARSGTLNSQLSNRALGQLAPLNTQSFRLLQRAVNRWRLSARSYTRILKVTRTIADLEGAETPKTKHLAEAIQLRCLDRSRSGDSLG